MVVVVMVMCGGDTQRDSNRTLMAISPKPHKRVFHTDIFACQCEKT